MRLRSLCVRRRPTGPRHGKGGPNGRQRAPAFVLIPTDARLGGFGLEVWGGIQSNKKIQGVRVREGSLVLDKYIYRHYDDVIDFFGLKT